ncbi:MAG: TonB-dependent receptor [Bacteroidia bacterium]|nr:TonB-dependent receptor [Bacteroidia bacterium]
MINKTKVLLRLSIILLFFASTSAIYAQTGGTIKGTITDLKTKEPLIGASVLIEGTSNGAAADLDGNFVINNIPAGTYTLIASYVAYESVKKTGIVVEKNREAIVNFQMSSDDISLQEVEVVARANRESENILLLEQKKALVATQAVGARELSRKGISDAQAAVAQVSGISKQEGVKNVFVRGLGDRYNATVLNGFPIPSEDPEYKNIALEFFGTDIIQNIGVNKVFSASIAGDVGGAVVDISSKELVGDYALALDLSAGVNTAALRGNFLRQAGSNYLGFANTKKPVEGQFTFQNSLDPKKVSLPLNHSYAISGGKSFKLAGNPLSFFLVASYNTDYSYTKEQVRNTYTNGLIWQDQTGDKYSQNISQLVLGNLTYDINRKHNLQYNFMMIHANDQYVGEYKGYNSERHQDSPHGNGFLRRQQANDNMLIVNQLMSNWQLSKLLKLNAGVSYNMVKGSEPDRRENYLSEQSKGNYIVTGSDRQKRFFSTLKNNDINAKAALTYKLGDRFNSGNSSLQLGYNGRFVDDNFEAIEYNFDAVGGTYPIENLKLDDLYNQQNMLSGRFRMKTGEVNKYKVTKFIHSGYAEATYQLLSNLSGNIGLRADIVDMAVDHHVQHVSPDKVPLKRNYFLPSLNLKYDVNDKNAIRLGVSKTYTLPQSKEISPYQYVNISFTSQGNANLKPSDNYNVDLKWDYYISPNELFSVTGFYKYILNPIGRVDEGNSAGLLTYNNISKHAMVGGMEMELRKNIFNRFNSQIEQMSRLSIGLNASYIYTNLKLNMRDTEVRNSQLEGASPVLVNMDLSYNYTKKDKNLIASIILNYFSNRIHTIGSKGYKDIIEEGVLTLDFAASYKFNRHLSLKAKASNLLDPSYRLSRKSSSTDEKIVLNEFKKGQNISLGISYEF